MRSSYILLLSLSLLAWGQRATAQQLPNAGSQLQLIPPSPAQKKAAPDIRLDTAQPALQASDDSQKLLVQGLRIMGARAYAEADLLAVSGWQAPREMSLGELRELAARITRHYRDHGYFLAQAYLPAQDIRQGVVTITVLEGHYGAITVRNDSGLSPALVDGVLQGLSTGDTVSLAPLEQRLLRLSDLPGVNVKSTLTPGASVGTSDLILDLKAGQRISGSVEADNHGSRYTGEVRVGATVQVNNLSGRGDVLMARALSAGPDLNYGRVAYQVQAGASKLGVAYAEMNYALGDAFASLGFSGASHITSVYGSYPLRRARAGNAALQLSYDDKTLVDRQAATFSTQHKSARVWTGSLVGDQQDAWDGLTNYALSLTQGDIVAQRTEARSDGGYAKLAWSVSHLHKLSSASVLQLALSGQTASKNLDSSEKMALGGAQSVRAYPEGETYGDQGYVLNVEARAALPRLYAQQSGLLQLVGFVDTGMVRLNRRPWDSSDNRRTLSGVGVGLNWASGEGDVVLKAFCAHKVGAAASTSAPATATRFWLQAVKYF